MTCLFSPVEGPRVFALPPGADFTTALVAGVDARLETLPPEAAAEVEIWVNTRRAQRSLLAAFVASRPARLLPRLRVIADLAADPLAPVDLPEPAPPLRRQLELARLVRALLAQRPDLAAERAAFDLADSLAALLDEIRGEGVAPDVFARVDAGGHAAHWQESLRFLGILAEHAASGPAEGAGRLRAVADAFAALWAKAPPARAVIVAGSTGSRGATRAFMSAVARLPQGALVLPGLDPDLPAAVWNRLRSGEAHAADHPQYGFARLASVIGFDPAAVPSWHAPAVAPAPARNALVSLALRPAPVTDQWRAEGAALAGDLGAALSRVTWLEAPDLRSEARAIALALHDAAATGRRAALITPDRTLARRVTAELSRWGIIPDDSAGRPLGLTPPGVLLRRLAGLAGRPLTAVGLLDLLKHPLVAGTPGVRGPHARLAARLELERLRGKAPVIDWEDLSGWAATPARGLEPEAAIAEGTAALVWVAWLRQALEPLAGTVRLPVPAHAARHRAAAEMLAAGPGRAGVEQGEAGGPGHGLWARDAGMQALALMDEIAAEADIIGPIGPADYLALFDSLLAGRDVPEEAVVADSGIAIWGALEARVQTADLVVLGGLNEGVWPRLPPADPWLSRPLRRELGLPSPEVQLGLAAHDFQQAAAAPEVLLARAERNAEAPAVASRWLLRLENLLRGLGDEGAAALGAAEARGTALLTRAARLDRPEASVRPALRPAPCPPVDAMPPSLSVTQVEKLVRDPYEVYALKILGLRRLDPPGRTPDALARGIAIHAVLEAFVAATADGLPEEAATIFRATLEREVAEAAPWPAVRAIWTARLRRRTGWLLKGEAERRDRGSPAAREVSGRREIAGLARPFAVTAKADRIDRMHDGRFALYDYKSGSIPSEKEARAFHLQLPLEAAILAAGGFEGLPAGEAGHLELIGIGAAKSLWLEEGAEAVAHVLERLRDLIGHYPEAGFVARLRPQRLSYESDYDHLSRYGEWNDGEDPAGGGA